MHEEQGNRGARKPKLLSLIGRFVPIRAARIAPADPTLVGFAQRLVLDQTAYDEYVRSPERSLRAAGLDPDELNVEWLSDVVTQLRARAAGLESVFDQIATEQTQRETEQATQWNFDRSSSSTTQYESHSSFDKGYTSQTSTGESSYTNKNFASSGIGRDPESLLRHELNLLFYPGQPLVTPGLISLIRAGIERVTR